MNRALSGDERAALDMLLARDFEGVEQLREQVPLARVIGGCDCGCGTVDLEVPDAVPKSTAISPVPVELTSFREGQPAGGVILFVTEGKLSSLEHYPLASDLNFGFPKGADLQFAEWSRE